MFGTPHTILFTVTLIETLLTFTTICNALFHSLNILFLIIINVVMKKKEYLKSVCHLPSDVNSKQTRNIVDKLVEKDGSKTKCEQQLL
jgi:hypothetical protein